MIADPSNVYSTSASVVAPAKIYAADYATPTPSNLTTAVLGMQTAYTDAAGRSPPDHLNLASGNLGGLTLAARPLHLGQQRHHPDATSPSPAAPTTSGSSRSPTTSISRSAKNVILSGGAQAKNIFWQVAGQVTIDANAHFEGVILCKTAITLQTNASLHGRALAQTLVALDNNAITSP